MKLILIASAIVVTIVAAVVIFMLVKNTTIPSGLGVHNGKMAPVPTSPNAVSSQTVDEKKKVTPFPFKGDFQETKEAIKQALLAYKNIEIHAEDQNYIHAISTTSTMKYHDDLEFYFDEQAGLVHFRSASRVGYSDMGLNQERYNRLKDLYN